MNDKLKKWMGELTDYECDQVAMLDAYFSTRSNLPGKSELSGKDLVLDSKTTYDIIDDLRPIIDIDPTIAFKYVQLHGYKTMTCDDGTLTWAIWRDIDMTGL